jgi:hypothetical protein
MAFKMIFVEKKEKFKTELQQQFNAIGSLQMARTCSNVFRLTISGTFRKPKNKNFFVKLPRKRDKMFAKLFFYLFLNKLLMT